jgi:hypothetical protein
MVRVCLRGCAARGSLDISVARSRPRRELAALLDSAGFVADETAGFTAAHSTVLKPCAGDGYLAAGDAALALDPLSSQGLLNALFTGFEATSMRLGDIATRLTASRRPTADTSRFGTEWSGAGRRRCSGNGGRWGSTCRTRGGLPGAEALAE